MSNEKKITQLNDDELEKISGGITGIITSLESGDVFLSKHYPDVAYVVVENVPIIDNNTEVPFVDATRLETGWKKGGCVRRETLSWLFVVANYSFELSKKI